MKYVRILGFILIAIGCVTFCQDDDERDSLDTLTGTWKLVKYLQNYGSSVEQEPAELPQSIVITFADDTSYGTLKGHTVTNKVFGEYKLYSDGEIEVMLLLRTKVAEPLWGDRFGDAISSASYFYATADQLFIFYGHNENLMVFARTSERNDPNGVDTTH